MSLIEEAMQATDDEDDDVRELRAEVATLRAQVESPKPKRAVLKTSLTSLRHVLEGAAGELLATHLSHHPRKRTLTSVLRAQAWRVQDDQPPKPCQT